MEGSQAEVYWYEGFAIYLSPGLTAGLHCQSRSATLGLGEDLSEEVKLAARSRICSMQTLVSEGRMWIVGMIEIAADLKSHNKRQN